MNFLRRYRKRSENSLPETIHHVLKFSVEKTFSYEESYDLTVPSGFILTQSINGNYRKTITPEEFQKLRKNYKLQNCTQKEETVPPATVWGNERRRTKEIIYNFVPKNQ